MSNEMVIAARFDEMDDIEKMPHVDYSDLHRIDAVIKRSPVREDVPNSPLNGKAKSRRSMVPPRRRNKDFVLSEEIDDLGEEQMREDNFVKQMTDKVTSAPAVDELNKTISSCWTAGWLMHLDRSIRPARISRRLAKDQVVMSFHLSLSEANDALMEHDGGNKRPFSCREVRDVCSRQLGRLCRGLRKEAFDARRVGEGVQQED